jgi:hypothetical protein
MASSYEDTLNLPFIIAILPVLYLSYFFGLLNLQFAPVVGQSLPGAAETEFVSAFYTFTGITVTGG